MFDNILAKIYSYTYIAIQRKLLGCGMAAQACFLHCFRKYGVVCPSLQGNLKV